MHCLLSVIYIVIVQFFIIFTMHRKQIQWNHSCSEDILNNNKIVRLRGVLGMKCFCLFVQVFLEIRTWLAGHGM